MKSSVEYIKRDISINSELYSIFSNPISLRHGGFLICLEGEIQVVVNMKQYNMRRGDIISATPSTIVQALHSSVDFRGAMLGVEVDFLLNTPITNRNLHYLSIVDNPCISLTDREVKRVLSLYNMLIDAEDEEHLFKGEINENISKAIIYEVISAYGNRTPVTSQKRTRDELIFDKFIFQLYTDYREQRKLEHYASLQQITSTHLSKAVKRVSGLTAGEWVVKCMIYSIKIRLRSEELPIYKIAEEFNFPNDSFFSQYFKKHSGQTPREYRKRERLQTSLSERVS